MLMPQWPVSADGNDGDGDARKRERIGAAVGLEWT